MNQNNMLILGFIILIVFLRLYSTRERPPSKLPFHDNIEKLTTNNYNYRQVLYTTNNMQLVLMALKPNEEIGLEVHPLISQFFRIEKGQGKALVNGKEYQLEDGMSLIVPPNTPHNIINTHPFKPLQLYTIYTPPQHPPNTLEKDKPLEDHH